jgi:putative ABC transport system permease protein
LYCPAANLVVPQADRLPPGRSPEILLNQRFSFPNAGNADCCSRRMLDFKAALRALRRSPAFTVGAVLTLAIALGVLTTALGLLSGAVSGKSTEPGRVVLYLTENVDGRQFRMRWPYPAIEILRSSASSFRQIASYTTSRVNATIGGNPIRLDVDFVSEAYFDILSTAPVLGRLPAPNAMEAAISHAAWQRLFGGSPTVAGREFLIARRPIIITGVMPEGFRGLSEKADAWLPHVTAAELTYREYLTSTEYFHTVIGQLRPDVAIERARSELAVIASRIASSVPPRDDRATARSADVVPFDQARRSPAAVRASTLVVVASVLVLLIAAVNIAMLVAARVAQRHREFAIRLAVGARRTAVFRVISLEIAIVMLMGVAAAALAALWASDLIGQTLPPSLASPANDWGQLARFSGVRIDPLVFGGVFMTAAIATIFIALPGCRRILDGELTELLKRVGAGVARAPGLSLRAMLAVEIAASIALLAGAGLVFRTIWAMSTLDPGFDPTNVIAFSVMDDVTREGAESGPQFVTRLLDAAKTARGVIGVTLDQSAPFTARGARLELVIEGRPEMAARPPVVGWHRVGPDHFSTLRIPILRGRGFTESDRRGRAPVVVINEAAARRFFPDQEPIGQRVHLPAVLPGDPDVAEIVGVVGNVVYWPPDEVPGPDVYQPALQFSYSFTTLMVRAAGDTSLAIATIREAIRQADANLPLFDIVTLEDTAAAARGDRRFLLVLLAVCAGLGVLLSAVGVFAVTASWMEGRRRELGMRIALGAQPSSVVRLVMRGTLAQAAIGTIGGIALGLMAGRLLQSFLFGVAPYDPATLGLAAAVMLITSVVAAYVPARRALQLDPLREINDE